MEIYRKTVKNPFGFEKCFFFFFFYSCDWPQKYRNVAIKLINGDRRKTFDSFFLFFFFRQRSIIKLKNNNFQINAMTELR